jgi:Glycosyl transferase family 2
MKIPLICHWSGDGDIARSFLDYYQQWASAFHLILHRSTEANRTILSLVEDYPIIIHASYGGPFDDSEKQRRLNQLLQEFLEQWIILVDSDELLELPCESLEQTLRLLENVGSSCMAAPLLQRLRVDGSLDSPEIVTDMQKEFPLCSERLYEFMGGTGWLPKFPLFRCEAHSSIAIGNHNPANGSSSTSNEIRGVTHHFKWRRSVVRRISDRIAEEWNWASTESSQYLKYLESHDFKLPTEEAFLYSRDELFRRQLLCYAK